MDSMVRSNYRIPREIDDWLRERAKQCLRSKNGQLITELRLVMSARGNSSEPVCDGGASPDEAQP
jgi:hypothetical protein